MNQAPTLVDSYEAERLAELHRYAILDTPAEPIFDHLAALAADVTGAPIGLLSLVDRDRIWLKATHGLDIDEVPREPGLCASAILQDDAWIIGDAAKDARAAHNGLVEGDFGLRFYAGAPLRTPAGHKLGMLSAIGPEPRDIDDRTIDQLKRLSAIAMEALELRRKTINGVGRDQTQ